MTFPGIKNLFKKAGLDLNENHWCHVYDFDYDPDKKILNWKIIKPEKCKKQHSVLIKNLKSEPNPVDMP